MALWLLLVRCVGPLCAGLALWKFVAEDYLAALLVVVAWLVVHFILMTLNARDVEWIRQGEQMRLQAERERRLQEQRDWEREHMDRWNWEV